CTFLCTHLIYQFLPGGAMGTWSYRGAAPGWRQILPGGRPHRRSLPAPPLPALASCATAAGDRASTCCLLRYRGSLRHRFRQILDAGFQPQAIDELEILRRRQLTPLAGHGDEQRLDDVGGKGAAVEVWRPRDQ